MLPLYAPDSTQLNPERIREAEHYNMSKAVPGRISSITNIHNPSIEVHTVESSLNTGAAVILAAGGGHRTLNVGSESADFVSYFYNYGVNTVILRNRLRADGYNVQSNAVNDAFQAIRATPPINCWPPTRTEGGSCRLCFWRNKAGCPSATYSRAF